MLNSATTAISMKLFTLLTLVFVLSPRASLALESFATETAYDENSSFAESLVTLSDVTPEPQLTATHEDTMRARVVAVINKSPVGDTAQTVRIYVDGILTYTWAVSTGREKFERSTSGRSYLTTTPVGYFRPTSVEENHHSGTWNASMPHAVFFVGGVAMHETEHVDHLGHRASGGCVRLAPENAKTFYDLVNSIRPSKVQAIDRAGKFMVDEDENPVMVDSWDVLIIVENHS